MLTGAVEIIAIYQTPTDPTLYANIVSEIIVAFPYTALALAGSALAVRQAGRRGAPGQGVHLGQSDRALTYRVMCRTSLLIQL